MLMGKKHTAELCKTCGGITKINRTPKWQHKGLFIVLVLILELALIEFTLLSVKPY